MLYKGTLNVYFPCELKNSQEIKRMRRMWADVMQGQRNLTRRLRFPNTNQMDILAFRQQKEDLLKAYQATWATRLGVDLPNREESGCYATPELADEYRHPREDNLFVKSVSLKVSSFYVKYPPLTEGKDGVCIEGKLIFHVNVDNRVATAIVVFNFGRLSVDDVILLKHTFYKRCHVIIYERDGERQFRQTASTFQEYVTSKLKPIYPYLETDIDNRARYMLLDVIEPIANYPDIKLRNAIIYGMLTSDEGWRHAMNAGRNLGRNHSKRDAYQLYYNRKNAIVVTTLEAYSRYIQEKSRIWNSINHAQGHVEIPTFIDFYDVAGIDKQLFAKYLKTVELDYLINIASTNEISNKIKKSLFNPIKLSYRAYRLWKILNELDMNLYHIDNEMHESFEITCAIDKVRTEYNEIIGLLTNFLLLLVAVLTLLATLVTILKQ